ncbi:hypothetical protein ACGFYY_32550 [Streptomyces sp. NPDC048331]|uniref:hypothetical protein n=1 Tax=Streptomyces sp. NPDC048331 TaxID=3365534 RepID=UPI0037218349
MKPPGVFYEDWEHPVGSDTEVMSTIATAFGPESGEARTMQLLLDYRRIYGPYLPLGAAGHLDLILEDTNLATDLAESMGSVQTETRDTVHSLHAQGLLLIADDGSLWLTVPPGTPNSAPSGQWAFIEKKADAPLKAVAG